MEILLSKHCRTTVTKFFLVPGNIYDLRPEYNANSHVHCYGNSIYIEKNTERARAARRSGGNEPVSMEFLNLSKDKYPHIPDLYLFYNVEKNKFWTLFEVHLKEILVKVLINK